MRSRARRVVIKRFCALLAVAAVSSLITGCVENLSPVEIGVRNGWMALVFCDDVTVHAVRVEQRPAEQTDVTDWEVLWEGTGERAVAKGEIFVLDDKVESIVGGPAAHLDRAQGTKFGLTLKVTSSGTRSAQLVFEPSFTSPSGGLQEGEWLDSWGQFVISPVQLGLAQ